MRSIECLYRAARSIAITGMRGDLDAHQSVSSIEAQKGDYLLRLFALGSLSAIIAIGLIAAQYAGTLVPMVFIVLTCISAVAIISIRRGFDHKVVLVASGASWVAAGGFLASESSLVAFCLTGIGLLSGWRALLFDGLDVGNADKIESDSGAAAPDNEARSFELGSSVLQCDRHGKIVSSGSLGDTFFGVDESLCDRIHLADRVGFLRLLAELGSNPAQPRDVEVRMNMSSENAPEQFERVVLSIDHGDDVFKITSQVLSDMSVEDVEPKQTQNALDTQILAVVSHELRTPLNAIIGFSDVMRGDIGKTLGDEKRQEYADLIHCAGTHLLSLVNTILDVSKIEAGAYEIHREDFAFSDTARECMSMLGNQADTKSIALNDRVSLENFVVNGDRRAIKQILINLLSNAIKYTPQGGIVTLDGSIGRNGFVFEVSDTGIGMSTQELEKIGKPFMQIDNTMTRENEGTGLGLALVKGLVELHGGTISFASRKDEGTKVRVEIPSSDQGSIPSNRVTDLAVAAHERKAHTMQRQNSEVSNVKRKIG